MSRDLFLDGRSGGFGDVWMRLAGLHAAAALRPDLRLRLFLAPELAPLASKAFAGRIDFLPSGAIPPRSARVYTNRGLKNLLPGLLRGVRYAAPLHRVVAGLKGRRDAGARLNALLFTLLDLAGRATVAPASENRCYFGRLESAAIPELRSIPGEALLARIAADFDEVRRNLQAALPPAAEAPGEEVLVFPSGKGHQYMPAGWAALHLPRALFAFHEADGGAAQFEERGLRTARFARPEEILLLARGRRRVVSTDSFPSHLLQYGCPDGTLGVVLTITRPETVITPGFRGEVFASTAPCSPCPHRERGAFPLCAQALPACMTWEDAARSARIAAFAQG
ncbi:MAG TPA: hypothetical protein VIM58_05805 [Candidatus Methylacidiphilales bacterium]